MTPDAKSTVSLEPPTTSAVVGAAAKSLPSYPEPIIKVERADSPTMKGYCGFKIFHSFVLMLLITSLSF